MPGVTLTPRLRSALHAHPSRFQRLRRGPSSARNDGGATSRLCAYPAMPRRGAACDPAPREMRASPRAYGGTIEDTSHSSVAHQELPMSAPAYVKLGGQEYAIVPRVDYERLVALAHVAQLPPLPASGRIVPAIEYARASIAREVLRRRTAAGLTQAELADLASVRVETICRLERGRNMASTASVAKLDRALTKAEQKRQRKSN